MKDLWNEICLELSDCKRRNVQEKEYENTIVRCLVFLGWKKSLSEITTQYPVQVGHETKLADIVVSSEGIEQFVIEVKRPSHVICQEDERQMFSYMRLLKNQVWFGLYIGDDIRLYYDDRSSQSFPEPLFIVDIVKDNPDGVRFVELFAKESFDIEKLQEFCRQKKDELDKEQKIKEEIERILSDKTGEKFKSLYREFCISNGLDEDFADRVLDKIVIDVRTTDVALPLHTASRYHVSLRDTEEHESRRRNYNKNARKHRHYTFEGKVCTTPGRLAFEIVKRFIDDNPGLTYNAINTALPPCIQCITKNQYSLKRESTTDLNFDTRWSNKFGQLLTIADNMEFVINTGWNYYGYGDNRPANICNLIEFARKQGYIVEEM